MEFCNAGCDDIAICKCYSVSVIVDGNETHALWAAFKLSIQVFGFTGRSYQLQASKDLATWFAIGEPVIGSDAVIILEAPLDLEDRYQFCRVSVSP